MLRITSDDNKTKCFVYFVILEYTNNHLFRREYNHSSNIYEWYRSNLNGSDQRTLTGISEYGPIAIENEVSNPNI